MANDVLWDCPPKTRAKLELIQSYLGAWFGILASTGFPHVVYVDGFCGPGKYKTGEEGSPIIAVRLANATAAKYPNFKATLIFIDRDEKALAHLQSLGEIKRPHPNVEIKIMRGEFAAKVEEIVAYLKAHPNSPTFSFIDPFGFGQSPFEKIRLLMHNERSELFINLMCGFMNRFKAHENPDVTAKIKGMLSVDTLDDIINASDPIDALCAKFEAALKSIGQFVLKFMMRDENNIRDNSFFFCGRNSRGFEKIKAAMWKTDPEGGNSFSSHREAQSETFGSLFGASAQTSQLSALLTGKFKGRKDVPVSEIFAWVIEKTDVFLPTHARKELESLLARQKISYRDPQAPTRKRRVNEWPDRLLITFAA